MSLLLLDTTFLIDAKRGDVDLDAAIGDDDDVAIAAITVAELLVGVELASGRRRKARQVYVNEMSASLPIIAYDHGVAVEHAELLVAVRDEGRPRGAHDLLIAATARRLEIDDGEGMVENVEDRTPHAFVPITSIRRRGRYRSESVICTADSRRSGRLPDRRSDARTSRRACERWAAVAALRHD